MIERYSYITRLLINFFKKHKWLSIGFFLLLFISFTAFFLNIGDGEKLPINSPTPTISSTSPLPILRKTFTQVTTAPKSGTQASLEGTIISFTTNTLLFSAKDFSLDIYPPPPSGIEFENTYPTKTIKVRILGSLKKDTSYTVTIKNKDRMPVYSWIFTTSPIKSPSGQTLGNDEQDINSFDPLFNYVPYSSANFDLDYTDVLTLSVIIKNPNVEQIKQEINGWIKSKGLDPARYYIIYTNKF